jgi:hypothetical protein
MGVRRGVYLALLAHGIAAVAAIAFLCVFYVGSASATQSEPDCADLSAETKRDDVLFARTWLPLQIAFEAMHSACKAHNFLTEVLSKEPDPKKITAEDVFEALTPDYPRSAVADRVVSSAKGGAILIDGGSFPISRDMIETPDGRKAYAEIAEMPDGYKKGTVIYADGSLERGMFNRELKPSGDGQIISPEGTMKAGRFSMGELDSTGIETFKEADGRTSMLEGTFCPKPCGEMVRRYSDGTSVRELWRGGQMVFRGEIGQKGQVPPKLPDDQRAPPSQPIWTPGAGEGLKTIWAREGEERVVLWCNGKLVDEGFPAPKGKALPPNRRNCRPPGPDGLHYVTDTKGRKRWELWCKGKIIDWNAATIPPPLQPCGQPVKQAQPASTNSLPATTALSNIWQRSDGGASLQILVRPSELEIRESNLVRKVPRIGEGTYREFQFNVIEVVWRLVDENTFESTALDHSNGRQHKYIWHREK